MPAVSPGILDAIEGLAGATPDHKVGGVLLGTPGQDKMSATVEAFLPAPAIEENRGEISISADSWKTIYTRLHDEHAGLRIVGWYHSHPNWGTALSDFDRLVHAVMFSDLYSLALVVDPIEHDRAWFGWQLDRVDRIDRANERTKEAAAAALAHAEVKRSSHRRSTASLVTLGLAAAAFGGFWVGDTVRHQPRHAIARPTPVRRFPIVAPSGSLGDQVRRLRSELAAAKAQVEANLAQLAATRQSLAATQTKLRQARSQSGSRTVTVRYLVKPGDSMWRIAEFFYGSGLEWNRVAAANPGVNPGRILVGQVLNVPVATG
jgi:proteasome lid subunit RPN8/RPN11